MATSTDPLTCSICLSEFKSPKILSCFHSFCKVCLSSYLDHWASNDSFQCPMCRCHICIPSGGVDEFANNYHIRTLPVNKETDEDCTTNKKTETVRHGDCENQPTSESCNEHKRHLDFFCRDCNIPMCCKCLLSKHKQHDFVDVEEVTIETRMKITELRKQMETKLSELSNFTKSMFDKISELNSDRDNVCLKVDSFVEEVYQVAKQLATDIKQELNLTSQADEQQLSALAEDYDKSILVDDLDQISQTDRILSISGLLNIHQKVNSDMEKARQWDLQEPTLYSLDLFNKINPVNFCNIFKHYLEAKFQNKTPARISRLLRAIECETSNSNIIGKYAIAKRSFNSRSLSNMQPIYSSDFCHCGTKWYLSIGQPQNSNKIWISLFFNGSTSQVFESVTVQFTLKLVNKENERKSLVRRGLKTFYPPKGLVADSYDWKDVIDKTLLTDMKNGFLDKPKRFKVVTEVTIASIKVT